MKDVSIAKYLTNTNPRRVKFWECCIHIFLARLANHSIYLKSPKNERYVFTKITNKDDMLNNSFDLFQELNALHLGVSAKIKNNFFSIQSKKFTNSGKSTSVIINEISIDNKKASNNFRISIANIKVESDEIDESIKGNSKLTSKKYKIFKTLLNQTRETKADLFILPENSIPIEYVGKLAQFCEKNSIACIGGLQHITKDKITYNFIINIIPFKIGTINDVMVIFRLKNHYAPYEELTIRGYGNSVPKPFPYEYDLINWNNIYFTSFYCFEIADTYHRSLFKSKIDLLIASEWNKDIPYFSNVVEASSRDLHCYLAQVNTSQYGDSRLIQPSETATKDIIKLKGGLNEAILVGEINIDILRNFQLKYFERTKSDGDHSFKPLPPDWDRNFVLKRIRNEKILS